MTREELKEHCERQIQQFERVEKLMPVTPNDWKRYEEHKLILELLENEPKWIKCSDKLPGMGVEVLGTIKDDGEVVKVARLKTCLEAAGWEWELTDDVSGTFYHPDEIIAWMPLPEAYKESEVEFKSYWIEMNTNEYSCSYCNHSLTIDPMDNSIAEMKFCPFCGAKKEPTIKSAFEEEKKK